MTESEQHPSGPWNEVGRRFEELGRALRGHFGHEAEPAAEAGGSGPGEAGPGEAGPGEAGPGETGPGETGDHAAMRSALRRLGQAAHQLGDHAGEAVRDPAVRESAQRAARTLADALDATFTGLGDDLRSRVRARRGGEPAGQEPGTEPGTAQPPPAKEIGGPEAP